MPASPLDLSHVTTLTFDCYGTLIDWEAGVCPNLFERRLVPRAKSGFALPSWTSPVPWEVS